MAKNPLVAVLSRAAKFAKPLSPALKGFTTPLTPTDYAGLFDPLRGREVRGRITAVEQHGSFTTLTIEPGPGMVHTFHAGQFIGLGLEIDGRWRWRCYSLTNAPVRHSRSLTVSVKPVPGGVVSGHVADHATTGQIIRLSAPGGDFYLSSPLPGKILFVTAGAGITPVMSMLRWLHQECPGDSLPDIVHIHSERGASLPSPFAGELADLSESSSNYRLVAWDSTVDGRLSPAAVKDTAGDWESRERYACGPGEMLETLVEAMPGTHTEQFHNQGSSAGTGDINPEDLGGEIEFGETGITVQSSGSTTILDAAEANGVNLVHGCRMGICRTCVTPITDGVAVDLRDGASYGPGEQIRTCSCVPSGHLHIANS